MSDSPQDFWLTEYVREKAEIDRVQNLLEQAWKTLITCQINGEWPYELRSDKQIVPLSKQSASTTSMILYALLSRWAEIDAPSFCLCSKPVRLNDISQRPVADQTEVEKTELKLQRLVPEILDSLTQVDAPQGSLAASDPENERSSFGKSSPLTWSWLLPILHACTRGRVKPKELVTLWQHGVDGTINCMRRLASIPFTPASMLSLPEGKGDPSLHSFPVVRAIYLMRSAEDILTDRNVNEDKHSFLTHLQEVSLRKALDDVKNPTTQNYIKSWFSSRLHEYLSYASIPDAPFDAAEMAFSLEGLLLFDGAAVGFDRDLLNRVFGVLEERQHNNPYWRPLKPLVVNDRGFALLPLSVEIVNSLFRSATLLGDQGERLFSEHRKVFHRYFEWIELRTTRGVCKSAADEVDFLGWYSEHLQQPGCIHVWETCQVLLYLEQYHSFVQRHLARSALDAANLTDTSIKRQHTHKTVSISGDSRKIIDLDPKQYWDHVVLKKDPSHEPEVLREIADRFIVPRVAGAGRIGFSMLLFGPPGTGKTTIAEDLARALNWKFIEITPSNFVAKGEAEVELRARQIFDALCEQSEAVILFDEIDRLILDRDSGLYNQQSDMFQVVTPGMLPKLKRLRSAERSIFVIATNYKERIDPAAIRIGRVDHAFLVGLPDLRVRMNILKNEVVGEILKHRIPKPNWFATDDCKQPWEPDLTEFLEVSNILPLANHGELCDVAREAVASAIQEGNGRKSIQREAVLKSLATAARKRDITARISAFRSRFQATLANGEILQTNEEPLAEFFHVVGLVLGADKELSVADKLIVTQVIICLCQKSGCKLSETQDVREILKEQLSRGEGEFRQFPAAAKLLGTNIDRWLDREAARKAANA